MGPSELEDVAGRAEDQSILRGELDRGDGGRRHSLLPRASAAARHGRTRDRLYVTWNQSEPQRDFDQYLLWVDPDSGLVDRVDFTIRALSGLAVATARFEDYDEVGGVKLASRIVIDAVLPTGHTLPVHTIEVESRRWDSFHAAAVKPDPGLPEIGEIKAMRP